MSSSKAVLLVVFAVLLISAEVSALRDLAETTTTPTTDQYGFGINQRNEGAKPGEGAECSKNKNRACSRNGVPKCNDPNKRECYRYGNGGKGGRGGHGPETKN